MSSERESCFDASACIRVPIMDASEMARRRWQNVPPEVRSTLARSAALVRWSRATEIDLFKARARAAKAREFRAKARAARLLGVELSDLAGLKVRVLPRSEFRRLKTREQNEYRKQLRKKILARNDQAGYPDCRLVSRSFRFFRNASSKSRMLLYTRQR